MKNTFMGLFMGITMLLFPAVSQAQNATDVAKIIEALPDDAKKQIFSVVSQQQAAVAATTQPSMLDQIGDLGKAIGIGIGEAAKSLGVAASDFFDTSAGTFVAILIGVKVIGPFFAKVFGILIFLILAPILIRFFARSMVTRHFVYDTNTKNIFGNYPMKEAHQPELSGEASVGVFVMIAAMFLAVTVMFITL